MPIQRIHCLCTETGQFTVMLQQRIRCHHSGATSIGDDCQSWPSGCSRSGQQLSAVEQVFDFVHTHDAGSSESGFVNVVNSGHSTCV
ncbi:MAG: hypothetical protein ACI8P0_001009 [Planctomycetaceae bacterium]|jgi:hypothetical protein